MKRNSLIAALVTVCLCNFLAAAESPTGTWKITTRYRNRARNTILTIGKENGKLTGLVLHHLGHRTPLERAHFEDGKLSFEVTTTRRGRSYTTKYEGILQEGVIKGTTEYRRGDEVRTFRWEARRTTSEELSHHLEAPPVEADVDLSDENYQVWRDHILPESSEMAWNQIPWLSTFKDGIIAANAAQRPLLLWTMNGHPLGCT